MRVDLKFRYSEEVFLRLSQSYNVVRLAKDKNFILVQVSDIQKHFLDTKQLTKQYLKKHI
jgi:hypothetical protein